MILWEGKLSETSTANPKLCASLRKDGKPCEAFAVHGSAFCFHHDPGKAAERAAARSAGGKARHGRQVKQPGGLADKVGDRQFRTLADMVILVEIAARSTLNLENSVARNRCLGYLARCWADLYQAGELEERLAALERTVQEERQK